MNEPKTGTLIPYLNEMFRYQAWMALGKVANPMNGEVERDLGLARQMIDLLSEVKTKTEGNRTEAETQMLQGTLTELRLNFVDEANKPEDAKPEEAGAESADPPGAESPAGAGDVSSEPAEAAEDAKPS